MKKEFKYNDIWLRCLVKVPFIFILTYLEYILYGDKVSDGMFYILSIFIMFIFVTITNKLDGRLFIKTGCVFIDDKTIKFNLKKEFIFDRDSIIEIEFKNIGIWNIYMSKIVITYKVGDKEKVFQVFSKDTKYNEQDEELFEICSLIK